MNNGQIVIAKVIDENEFAYYAQYEGLTYEILKDELEDPLHMGERVEGMIYENRLGKKVMQTQLPDIRPGYFGWGTVTDVRKDLGVFIDVGINEKDVVLSLDDLPENRQLWPRKNDTLYVSYHIDTKGRFWAELADIETFNHQLKKATPRLMNQSIEVTIYQVKLAGFLAISTEGYRVFVHESEQVGVVRLGQQLSVRVINVARDGSLNASMKPRAHEVIGDDAAMLVALLEKSPQKFLNLHDKSTPEAIQAQLGISKAQFKRAVGQLLKQQKIRQEKEKGIFLI